MDFLTSSVYKTTPDQVAGWLAAGQSVSLAFLSDSAGPRKMAETLVALANTHGGALLLGVGAGGQPGGLLSAQATENQAVAAALMAEPPLVLPLPEVIQVDGKDICVVHVPAGLSQVYSVKGQYWMRAERENRTMSTAELRMLLVARGEAHFESSVVPGARRSDLDDALVSSYLERLAGLTATSVWEALLTRGCVKATPQGEYAPTYAGVLLFGRNPQQFLPSAEIVAVRYAGPTMGDEFVREDIHGTLADQIRRQKRSYLPTCARECASAASLATR
ncbi:MAG: putative DNA binding domain-containing protein [Caldilineales bacterium]